jgi:hypothetical protein
MGGHTELLLSGIDPETGTESVHRRLACLVEGSGTLVLWGTDGNIQNIDVVLEAGFPCLIACDWEDPPAWAQALGQAYWVPETAHVRVIHHTAR